MTAQEAILRRKTQKVLGDVHNPLPPVTDEGLVDELLALAAAAPYHKPSQKQHHAQLDSPLPYRFYVLDAVTCRTTLVYIQQQKLQTGKIAQMLAAAQTLFIVTWLPNADEKLASTGTEECMPFAGHLQNMEHIAAGAAAIQNVLLGATARGVPNYWSTGGHLRLPELRRFLQVPLSEVLLGAIFIFPVNSEQLELDIKPGKMRHQGKAPKTWSRRIQLP